jgi:hypothetical protein
MATQVFSIVNDIVQQDLGLKNISVIDNQGLIAIGDTILSSQSLTDEFLNILVKRIGKTVIDERKYKNRFSSLMKDNFEWGAILQKIKFGLIKAESDQSYNLVDGASVDMYKVNKPIVKQSLFYTETPYQFHITIQREHLKEAFTSESVMGSFISGIYTSVQNEIEYCFEGLGRLCLCNLIAELSGGKREIKLLTEYNALMSTTLTPTTALFDNAFLRWATKRMKDISRYFENFTKGVYNDGSIETFSSVDNQKMFILSSFETTLESEVTYSAFHENAVKLNNYEEVAYWQAVSDENKVLVNRASDGKEIEVENVVGVLMDKDCAGSYKQNEWTSTTPVNSAGGYFNTYYHYRQLWFNDLGYNAVIFTLN